MEGTKPRLKMLKDYKIGGNRHGAGRSDDIVNSHDHACSQKSSGSVSNRISGRHRLADVIEQKMHDDIRGDIGPATV